MIFDTVCQLKTEKYTVLDQHFLTLFFFIFSSQTFNIFIRNGLTEYYINYNLFVCNRYSGTPRPECQQEPTSTLWVVTLQECHIRMVPGTYLITHMGRRLESQILSLKERLQKPSKDILAIFENPCSCRTVAPLVDGPWRYSSIHTCTKNCILIVHKSCTRFWTY